ncbi:hypothetical protein KXW38_002376, partial [Aspergillus fumigatus]
MGSAFCVGGSVEIIKPAALLALVRRAAGFKNIGPTRIIANLARAHNGIAKGPRPLPAGGIKPPLLHPFPPQKPPPGHHQNRGQQIEPQPDQDRMPQGIIPIGRGQHIRQFPD